MKQYKRKLRLRKEVKLIIISLIVLIPMFIYLTEDTKKAIEKCVNAGLDRSYCERVMR